jgi:hypothetical protein
MTLAIIATIGFGIQVIAWVVGPDDRVSRTTPGPMAEAPLPS